MESLERLILRAILVALVILGVLIGFAVWHARQQQATARAAAAIAPASTAITLLIDYGDGTQRRFTDLAHTPGMSVLDAMRLGAGHARPLGVAIKGEGEMSLLTRIDDLKNETPTTAASPGAIRAWQFWINGQYGQVSLGAAKLNPGDRVSWAYRVYESDPKAPRE